MGDREMGVREMGVREMGVEKLNQGKNVKIISKNFKFSANPKILHLEKAIMKLYQNSKYVLSSIVFFNLPYQSLEMNNIMHCLKQG